ncbi:hypothetical protein I7I53_08487 [Histoplasma capsulatum var. duboisii H88]|uniref:Uncharacterized protein n=1 Tax=Ajellomyces capsulatus (strain H88) TaxID=544711 RepID=A0A8A1LFU7_AJEC8|nr:hypothetical protein I7I53_08487 [Histoplasma capsulatum var. duboisii H88]
MLPNITLLSIIIHNSATMQLIIAVVINLRHKACPFCPSLRVTPSPSPLPLPPRPPIPFPLRVLVPQYRASSPHWHRRKRNHAIPKQTP